MHQSLCKSVIGNFPSSRFFKASLSKLYIYANLLKCIMSMGYFFKRWSWVYDDVVHIDMTQECSKLVISLFGTTCTRIITQNIHNFINMMKFNHVSILLKFDKENIAELQKRRYRLFLGGGLFGFLFGFFICFVLGFVFLFCFCFVFWEVKIN